MKKIKKIILSIFLACISFFSTLITPLLSPLQFSASAETVTYSNVLEDLRNSSNFNENDYSINGTDNRLSVVTIAESEDLQLFVYVYQPSYGVKTLTATSINISIGIEDNLSFQNYDLIFLGQESVFQKYVVSNFVVKDVFTRYYEISSIFRLWDSTMDSDVDKTTENSIDEVSFKVGKRYKFEDYGKNVSMSVDDIDLITVTDKYVGFLRYPKGYFNYNASDFHFIAFSTDKAIDKLLEVDVLYSSYGFIDSSSGASAGAYKNYYYECACGESKKWSDGHCSNYPCGAKINTQIVNLQFGNTLDFDGGWFVKDRSYQVIEKASTFLTSANTEYVYDLPGLTINVSTKINDSAKEIIGRQQWCIRFLRTDYNTADGVTFGGHYHQSYSTRVEKVSLMRLAFQTDGESYNLGVVDNKQTGSSNPINETDISVELSDWMETLFSLIAGLALLILFWPFLSPIISLVFSLAIKLVFGAVKLVIKLLLWVLSLPLKLLKFIFKKRE